MFRYVSVRQIWKNWNYVTRRYLSASHCVTVKNWNCIVWKKALARIPLAEFRRNFEKRIILGNCANLRCQVRADQTSEIARAVLWWGFKLCKGKTHLFYSENAYATNFQGHTWKRRTTQLNVEEIPRRSINCKFVSILLN